MEKFTARNVAKHVVMALIATQTSKFTKNLITDYTAFDEDSTTVDLGSHIIGWGVSSNLKPVTDKLIDKTADFVNAKREARLAKKKNAEMT